MIKKRKQINTEYPAQLDKLKEDILNLPKGVYEVFVTDHRPQRSLQQNAYFHGIVLKTLSDHFGYTIREMKQILAYEFYPEYITQLGTTEIIKIPGSTSNMNTKQMTELIDQVRQWAQDEHDVFIPAPNEISNEQLVEYLHNASR